MKRERAISLIKDNAGAIHALGAGRLYLYGSIARDEFKESSDIDIFIDRDPALRFGFVELTELDFLLHEILGADIDVSTRSGLHPAISSAIEKDAIRVL